MVGLRLPVGDIVGNRGVYGHPCNYPELIQERYLFFRRVPVRYSRDICFVRMRVCGEIAENHCDSHRLRVPTNAEDTVLRDDLAPFLHNVLAGRELTAEQTFPAHYEHDAVLAGKLVEFFHREQRRLGRPPKVVDLGAGRGTMLQELRAWNVVAVGVEANPIISGVVPELSKVGDIAGNLSFTVRSMHPRCDFEPVWYMTSPGMDFESGDHTALQRPRSPASESADNPLAWVHWLNFMMGRCCMQLSCVAFSTNGLMKYGLRPSSEWVQSPHAWTYIKKDHIPLHGDAAIEVPNQAGPGTLVPADIKRGGTMDWVLSLDAAEQLLFGRYPGFFGSIVNLAGQGAILSMGRHATESGAVLEAVSSIMLQRGFRRDHELEAELRLFAGVGCCGHLSRGLLVFRRIGARGPARCGVGWPARPAPWAPGCKVGLTHGCYDSQRVWVRRKCGGLFESRTFSVFCDTVTPERWEYEMFGPRESGSR